MNRVVGGAIVASLGVGVAGPGCHHIGATVERERILTHVERLDADALDGQLTASRFVMRMRDGAQIELGEGTLVVDADSVAVLGPRSEPLWLGPRAAVAAIDRELIHVVRTDVVTSEDGPDTTTQAIYAGILGTLFVLSMLASMGGAP